MNSPERSAPGRKVPVFIRRKAEGEGRFHEESVFSVGVFSNKRVLLGIGVELVLICALSYVPFLQGIFNTAPLAITDWLLLIVLPFPVLLLEELRKLIVRRRNNHKGGRSL